MSSGPEESGLMPGGIEGSSSFSKSLSKDWVVGFIEAEGSFTHSATEYNTYPKFCMTQRNREILEKIADLLPVDIKVYECKDDFYRLSFRGRDKIRAMIEFLDGELHAEYSQQRFGEWKNIYRAAYGSPAIGANN